jgi:hypothetical protein
LVQMQMRLMCPNGGYAHTSFVQTLIAHSRLYLRPSDI